MVYGKWRSSLALLVLALGCSDRVATPTDAEIRPTFELIGEQNPPANLEDDEWYFPPALHVKAEVGFDNGSAYAFSHVRYTGNHGVAIIDLGTNVGNDEESTENSHLLPAPFNARYIYATANVYMGTCGETLSAHATGETWNSVLTFGEWGKKRLNDYANTGCSGPAGGGGGGGGGGYVTVCYDVWLHWPDGSHPDQYLGQACFEYALV